jgi:site-specific DNA recombinase
MRAAIYARVSTEMQEREGTSLESQVARCLAYVEERDWVVERVVQEQGSGGDIDGRPKLQSLLTLARAGHIDALVCYHIDRLSRDVDDQGWLRRELRKAGVELVLVTGQQDPVGQLVEGFAGMQERKQASERTTRGKRTTAQNGTYLPGHPPYGYRHRRELVGRVDKVVALDEDPVTSPILRELFDGLARGGSMTGLARSLNERGIPAPRGTRWRPNTIQAVVSNPIYQGKAVALRYESHRDPRDRSRRSMKHRPAEGQVPLPPTVAPALVTPTLWQRANAQLAAAARSAPRRNPEPERYLLRAGHIFCGSCGSALVALRSGRHPTYRCKAQVQAGCKEGGYMRAAELDDVVWNTIKLVLQDPDWIRQQLAEQAHDASLADRLSSTKTALRQLRQEEGRLAARLGELDDPTAVIARLNEVSGRRKATEAELDDLLFQQHHAEQIAQRLNGFSQRFLDACRRVDTMSYEEKRTILREFEVRVTLWRRDHDPRFTLDWAFDLGTLDWWQTGEMEEEDHAPWVIYTTDGMSPSKTGLGFNSSA